MNVRAIYGFLAPTGRFKAGASNNVGSGYWTHVAAAGETFYLTDDGAIIGSAFQMYEFHTTQEGTGIHPGETFNLDYSLMGSLRQDEQPELSGRTGRLRAASNQRQDRARDYVGPVAGTLRRQLSGIRC